VKIANIAKTVTVSFVNTAETAKIAVFATTVLIVAVSFATSVENV